MRFRGAKGARGKLEQQPQLVVLEPESYKGKWSSFFGNDNPIHVELGMGKGQFITQMSIKHPNVNFIGVDMYDALLAKASEKYEDLCLSLGTEERSKNLGLALFNIMSIENVFAPGELDRIYLNFSDPWPKNRHARRRLTHPDFLNKYVDVLHDKGEIHLKTDSTSLFEFSLNTFSEVGFRLQNISLSLHAEGISEEHVMTEYETKFVQQGMPIYRCEAKVPPRP